MMVSLSHWGMFDVAPRILTVPAGFKLSEEGLREWQRGSDVLVLLPLEHGEPQPVSYSRQEA